MDIIYVKQGKYEKGDAAFPVIRKAVSLYFKETGGCNCKADEDAQIDRFEVLRTEKGKPYVEWSGNTDFMISVTHSGDIWMCMVSRGDCGIDFQYVRNVDEFGIPDRFFTENERSFIKGHTGRFFDVWVRREAFGKFAGDGFFGEYPDTCKDGRLKESVEIAGRTVFVHEITGEMLEKAGVVTNKEFRSVCVSLSEDLPEIKVIVG